MAKTKRLGLNLTEDESTSFEAWRESIDGNNGDGNKSNMQRIDDAMPLVVDEVLLLGASTTIKVGYTNSIDLESLNRTPCMGDRFWGICKSSDGYVYSFVAKITDEDYTDGFAGFEFVEVVLLHDVLQKTGYSKTSAMSQKAVTDLIGSDAETINWYNKDDERNISGYIVRTGTIYEDAVYRITHPITVQANKTYKMPFSLSSLGANNNKCRVEDADGNFIKVLDGTLSENSDFICFSFEEDCIARFNIGVAGLSRTFMVAEESKYPEEYTPYGNIIEKLNTHNKGSLVNAINELQSATSNSNPLYGKSITLNGDSICRGAGFSGGYGKIIADANNMTYQNIGISGGTITAETYVSNDVAQPRHWICRTIANMNAGADYAIVEGGVNDASLSVPLGEITADFKTAFDDTTFYGAFESMLKQLITRFAGKKYGYIAVHQMTAKYRASDSPETSYYWAAKKCCEKWGVPFLDLNISVPPFGIFPWSSATPTELKDLTATYTHNGDGWHPNEEGYKKYYVPKIEAWLKTL